MTNCNVCGINLIVDKRRRLSGKHHIEKMNGALHHRGPDAEVDYLIHFHDCDIYLGYVQLKIQDKQASIGHSTRSPDLRHYLALNGQIYNHLSLRNDQVEYVTNSDCETLVKMLSEFGESRLEELEGMFSFIHVDANRERIIIVRDRHGVKPVFYYEDENYLIVSSELRGIFASGLVKKEPNTNQINHYLKFKHARKPFTMYRNVYELEEQRLIDYQMGKSLIKEWRRKHDFSERYTLEQLLTRSVERRLSGDYPIGIMLSGGVDSTLLLSIMNEMYNKPLPCYTITANRSKFYGTRDAEFARSAVRQYGGEHIPIEIDRNCLDRFPEFMNTIDQPIGDGAHFLTWLLCEQATKDVRVLINGGGADELFAGYNRHRAYNFYLKYLLNKPKSQAWLRGSTNITRSKSAKKILGSIGEDPHHTFINMTSTNLDIQHTLRPQNWNGDLMNRALEHDKRNYLISDILALNDQASMHHSIEMRVPYLDNAVVNLAMGSEGEYKLKHGQKWILKRLLKERKGKKYSRRRKEGFGVQFGKWMLEKTAFIEDLGNSNNPIFEFIPYNEVDDLIEAHKSTKVDHKVELWLLKTLSEWMKQF